MIIHEQIRKYRLQMGYSQEQLAEKVLVSRQTISNWETGKSIPDIQSLILLSNTLKQPLELLVLDPAEEVKKEKLSAARNEMKKLSAALCVCWGVLLLLVWPVIEIFKLRGIILLIILWAAGMYFALKIEKIKKNNGLKTFKQISEFLDPNQKPEKEMNGKLINSWLGKMLFGAGCMAAAIGIWLLISFLLSF